MKRILTSVVMLILGTGPVVDAGQIFHAGSSVSWQGFTWDVVYGTATLQDNGDLTLTSGRTGIFGDNQGLIRLHGANLPAGITEATYSFDAQNGRTGMFVYLDHANPQPRFEVGSVFNGLFGMGTEALAYRTDHAGSQNYFNIFGFPSNSPPKSFSAAFGPDGILAASTTNANGTYHTSTDFFSSYAGNDFAEILLRVRSGFRGGSTNLTSFTTNLAPAAVPEPATLAMALSGGLVGLLAMLRRRRCAS